MQCRQKTSCSGCSNMSQSIGSAAISAIQQSLSVELDDLHGIFTSRCPGLDDVIEHPWLCALWATGVDEAKQEMWEVEIEGC